MASTPGGYMTEADLSYLVFRTPRAAVRAIS
jgi:hypothetical protein